MGNGKAVVRGVLLVMALLIPVMVQAQGGPSEGKDSLADRVTDLESDVSTLQTDLGAAQGNIGTLQTDLADLQTQVDALDPALAPRFVDNDDGTITDKQTGLMWEKKVDSGGIHNVGNVYSWTAVGFPVFGTAPDGTLYTVFLPTLNNDTTSDPSQVGLAGHTDWRIPNIVELQTILDCTQGIPCIDPVFGPTAASLYWSSTSHTSTIIAWQVNFLNGVIHDTSSKSGSYRVRAVRGGP